LEFFRGGLFDLADHGAEGEVAGKPRTGLSDRFHRDDEPGEPTLHVVGPEAPDPAVARNALRTEAFADEMLFIAAVRGVHVAGEQQIVPVAIAAHMSDGIR